MRKTSENTCKKKMPYKSRASALKAKKILYKRYGNKKQSDLHPYQCNVCNKWHLGHRQKNIDFIFNNLDGEKNDCKC